MVIPRHVLDAMIEHARAGYPNEACGLLAGNGQSVVHFYPIDNADASPVHYRMEPTQQLKAMLDIDDREWELAGIYHSHTRTRAWPSPTDIKLAAYPDALYVIVSLADVHQPDVRAFSIHDGAIEEQPIEIGS